MSLRLGETIGQFLMMKMLLTVAVLAVLAAPVWGQSLGDVARKEEERRKTVDKSGKVYTNGNLRAEPAPSLPTAAASPGTGTQDSGSAGQPGTGAKPADEAKPGEMPASQDQTNQPKDEKYWRDRITAARTSLSRSQMFSEALQTRINALSADFVNRDDPAQRAVIEADRVKALAELDRVKTEIQQQQKAISDIEDEARRARVPPGWLR